MLKKLFTAVVQRSAKVMGCDKCTAPSWSLAAGNSSTDTISAVNCRTARHRALKEEQRNPTNIPHICRQLSMVLKTRQSTAHHLKLGFCF